MIQWDLESGETPCQLADVVVVVILGCELQVSLVHVHQSANEEVDVLAKQGVKQLEWPSAM